MINKFSVTLYSEVKTVTAHTNGQEANFQPRFYNYTYQYPLNQNMIEKFNDGEISAHLKMSRPDERFLDVSNAYITGSLSADASGSVNDSLMEVILIIDALKRAEIKNIKFACSYMPYLRQDRRMNSVESDMQGLSYNVTSPISAQVIISILSAAGLSSLSVLEPHFAQFEMLSTTSMTCVSLGVEYYIESIIEAIVQLFYKTSDYQNGDLMIAIKAIAKACRAARVEFKDTFPYLFSNLVYPAKDVIVQFLHFIQNELVIVAADAGALKNVRFLSKLLTEYFGGALMIFNTVIKDNSIVPTECINVGFLEKIRSGPGNSACVNIIGEFNGRTVLIFDDILDSGGTLIGAANKLRENGAKSVNCFITHALFSRNAEEQIMNSCIENCFITNSTNIVKQKDLTPYNKFTVFDLSNTLALSQFSQA